MGCCDSRPVRPSQHKLKKRRHKTSHVTRSGGTSPRLPSYDFGPRERTDTSRSRSHMERHRRAEALSTHQMRPAASRRAPPARPPGPLPTVREEPPSVCRREPSAHAHIVSYQEEQTLSSHREMSPSKAHPLPPQSRCSSRTLAFPHAHSSPSWGARTSPAKISPAQTLPARTPPALTTPVRKSPTHQKDTPSPIRPIQPQPHRPPHSLISFQEPSQPSITPSNHQVTPPWLREPSQPKTPPSSNFNSSHFLSFSQYLQIRETYRTCFIPTGTLPMPDHPLPADATDDLVTVFDIIEHRRSADGKIESATFTVACPGREVRDLIDHLSSENGADVSVGYDDVLGSVDRIPEVLSSGRRFWVVVRDASLRDEGNDARRSACGLGDERGAGGGLSRHWGSFRAVD
ncbi:hypothetical protein B0T16DRAFT_403041, partial [Cercophora newfieldiana]